MWRLTAIGQYSSRELNKASLAVPTTTAIRAVGTQTSHWRQKQILPVPFVGGWRRVPEPKHEAGLAASIAHRASLAAIAKDAKQCATLLWELKDLPRIGSIREAVESRLKHGSETESSIPPLQATAAAGLADCVALCLDLNANVRTKDENGLSPLHHAAIGNHAETAQVLLARGRSPVDTRDAKGRTPLHAAAVGGHARVGRVLVRFGADPEAKDADGKTPLQLAKTGGEGRLAFEPWLKQFLAKRTRASEKAGKTRLFKLGNADIHADIVAPKLTMTTLGYFPIGPDGKMVKMKRAIRVNKKRSAPSSPKGIVNWYAVRG